MPTEVLQIDVPEAGRYEVRTHQPEPEPAPTRAEKLNEWVRRFGTMKVQVVRVRQARWDLRRRFALWCIEEVRAEMRGLLK